MTTLILLTLLAQAPTPTPTRVPCKAPKANYVGVDEYVREKDCDDCEERVTWCHRCCDCINITQTDGRELKCWVDGAFVPVHCCTNRY